MPKTKPTVTSGGDELLTDLDKLYKPFESKLESTHYENGYKYWHRGFDMFQLAEFIREHEAAIRQADRNALVDLLETATPKDKNPGPHITGFQVGMGEARKLVNGYYEENI